MVDTLRRFCGVGRVLHVLQKKHHWLAEDASVCFVAGPWQHTLLKWIAGQQSRERRAVERLQRQRTTSRGTPVRFIQLRDEASAKKRFLESTLSDPHGGGDYPATSFYVFADAHRRAVARLKVAGTDVTPLPFTTAEAASYVRRQSNGSNAFATTTNLQLEASAFSDKSFRGGVAFGDSCAVFLDRHTSDVVAVDFTEPQALEEAPVEGPSVSTNTRQNLIDTMTLSTHLLKPTGAVLLRFPSCMRLSGDGTASVRAVLRHMRWIFQECACEADGEHFYYLGCRSTADHQLSGNLVTSFPGFLKKSERRPKRWNPRKGSNCSYFAALMPSFTNAPPVMDPLGHAATQAADVDARVEERADAFLNLSVEMVERGLYNRKRDD